MATLVLQAAGSAVGGMIAGPFGAMIGRAAGGIAGSFIDQALFGKRSHTEGPRLKETRLMGSSEGAPIAKVYGRNRISGQVIWATRFREVATTSSQGQGGKGSLIKPKNTRTEFSYFSSFAVGLCEGEISGLGRVWADGKEIDISAYTWRLYKGTASQQPDSFIIAKQGANNAPAYRGIAYVVFEDLPLERFGNRLPQLSFEVFKALDDIESKIRAVNIIPGATEFGYDPQKVTQSDNWGQTRPENTHASASKTDWETSLDQLQDTCKNISTAALVVAWFGDDLRCDQIKIRPGVESADKQTTPAVWSVSGLERQDAPLISTINGFAAFGSTPDDASVLRAIADLKSRGIKPIFYPFILMDIPSGSPLPDPYNPGGTQPAYPWRGRISCNLAPGLSGTPDKTNAMSGLVSNFFGNAQPAEFSISSGSVIYSGPADWGYRRMVLHYANLCALAGGVEAFLIGSELRGLTRLRDDNNNFPVVAGLVTLAAEVSQILPDAKISYAADWSEYFGYQPTDGSGDVFFNLDPLWSSPHLDFIGIDNYMPLSDWRDEPDHLDAAAGAKTIYDLDYLQGNIVGGEGYDWYYASPSDRENQIRTSITDGAYNKPWVFRYKDLKSWWSSYHYNRPGGVEAAGHTGWSPRSKPLWFTETGCPAINKGTNQPNVFYDPKSSESFFPYSSSGIRDDFIQRKYIEALLTFWDTSGSHNPVSPVYGKPMLETQNIIFWAWDARPFPAFPYLTDIWSDGANYARGHWINGRLGSAPLSKLVAEILGDFGFDDFNTSAITGVVDGYIIDQPMSARQAIEPLASLFAFDGLESEGILKFRTRDEDFVATLNVDDLVETKPQDPVYTLKRAQETDLPNRLEILFLDGENDYHQSTVNARMLTGSSARQTAQQAPVVISSATARTRAEISLHEIWSARETASFALPPNLLKLEPGDVAALKIGEQTRLLRIETIGDGSDRKITASRIVKSNYQPINEVESTSNFTAPAVFGQPLFHVLNLPLVHENANPFGPWIAARARPWPGDLALLESTDGGYINVGNIRSPAVLGQTQTDLAYGPPGRLDYKNTLRIQLAEGELSSVTRSQMLSGANVMAVGDLQTGWEIIQFQNADLVSENVWDLSVLLRGLAGSEPEILGLRPSQSTCVLLNDSVVQLATVSDDLGRPRQMRIGPAVLDHGNDAYAQFSQTPDGLALRPLSPVHLSARAISGGLSMSWIRRTRIGGDSWALNEVPLSEDSESYIIEIMSGASVARTMTATAPTLIYSDADRQTDFGLPLPQTLTFRVAQISDIYGPGTFKEITQNV